MKHDLADVRIHMDDAAARAADAIDARAWTVGSHVGLGSSAPRIDKPAGLELLVHELVHVQQSVSAHRSAALPPAGTLTLADPLGAEERVASRGGPAHQAAPGAHVPVYRQQEGPAVVEPEAVLAPEEDFRWVGAPQGPELAVRTSFLIAHGVRRGTRQITGRRHREVLEPILLALLAFWPWASEQRARRYLPQLALEIPARLWDRAEIRLGLHASVFTVIGLPPQAPIQVVARDGGARIIVDLVQLYPAARESGVTAGGQGAGLSQLKAAVAEEIVQTLESVVGHPASALMRGDVVSALVRMLPATPQVWDVKVGEGTLRALFGEVAYRRFTEQQAAAAEGGVVLRFRTGEVLQLPPGTTAAQMETIRTLLRDLALLPPAERRPRPEPGAPAAPQARLTTADVKVLLELARSEDRETVVAELRQAGHGTPRGAASLQDLIEAARERIDWRSSAAQLGATFGPAREERPIVPRPVHGVIRNPDQLVPGLEAHFTFETTDAVDAFAVPHVSIHWYARAAPDAAGRPGRVIEDDITNYVEVRPHSVLNERVFEVTFDEPGLYEVHAFVNHSFYLPAHFVTTVRVESEAAVLAEYRKQAEPRWGREGKVQPAYRFSEIASDEKVVRDLLSSAVSVGVPGTAPIASAAAGALPESGYAVGTRAEGRLTRSARSEWMHLFPTRKGQLEAEVAELTELERQYGRAGVQDAQAVLATIRERIARLKKAIDELERLDTDPTRPALPVATRAYYVSRTHGVPTSPLTLISYVTTTGVGPLRRYHGHILDQTELLQARHYHFQRSGNTFAEVMEGLFVDLSKEYPNGRVSFAFQVLDEATQQFTDRFVRFERVTETVGRRISDVAFSEAASVTINLVSLLLTLFPPTTVVGITIGLAYNAAQTARDIADDLRRGTLDAGRTTVALLQIGLDLVPLVGRAGRFVRVGTRLYRVVDAAQIAGMSYLLSEDAELQIRTLREGLITQLLEVRSEVQRRSTVNASDPALKELRRTEDRLLAQVRSASAEVYTQAIATQGLMLAATKAVGLVAEAGPARRGRPVTAEEEPRLRGEAAETRPAARRGPEPLEVPAGPPSRRRTPADWERMQGALGDLAEKVPINEGADLTGNAVRVHYGADGDLRIRVGPEATAEHIRRHLPTVRMLRRYEGVLGRLLRLLSRARSLLTGYPPYGSAGFEARAEITKLSGIIDELEARLTAVQTRADRMLGEPPSRARAEADAITGEIEALQKQLARFETEVDSLRPGRGYVAAESTTRSLTRRPKGARAPPEGTRAARKEVPAPEEEAPARREGGPAPQEEAAKAPSAPSAPPPPAAPPDLGSRQARRQALEVARARLEELRAERAAYNAVNREVEEQERLRAQAAARQGDDPVARARGVERMREAVRRREEARQRRDQMRNESEIRADIAATESDIRRFETLLDPNSRAPIPCFEGSTPVLVPGGRRMIAELRPGDHVLTLDVATDTVVTGTVQAVHRSRTQHWHAVAFGEHVVLATARHRFRVKDRGWVEARRLRPGDAVLRHDGPPSAVSGVTRRDDVAADSWNLTVASYSSYFVGPGILVHNQGVDLGFGGPWIVYRGTNPDKRFAGKVYIGQTEQGHDARQKEHRYKAEVEFGKLDAQRRVRQLTAREQRLLEFYDFMRGIELASAVTGIPNKALADFIEQHNIRYEETYVVDRPEDVMNRREQIVRTEHMEDVLRQIREDPRLARYCPA